MANIGSLGMGGALSNALNNGLDLGNKFAAYQKAMYTDASDQINDLQKNNAEIWGNRVNEVTNANIAAGLESTMQGQPMNEVQNAQFGQAMSLAGYNTQAQANQAVIANALNNSVYGGGIYGQANGAVVSPQDMGARFFEQLRLNGGDPNQSLGGVINGN